MTASEKVQYTSKPATMRGQDAGSDSNVASLAPRNYERRLAHCGNPIAFR